MRKPVITLVLAAAWAPAWSADTPPAIDKLVACTDVKDSGQRLSCFDREIAPLARAKASSAPVSSGISVAPGPPPAAASAGTAATPGPTPTLGQEQLASRLKPPKQDSDLTLHANIAAIRQVASGTFLVSLDNGQAWRHEDQTQGAYLRVGEAITISKAAMGSYRLTRDAGDSKNWIRVSRTR
ncbi:MAG: hypothetical protein ABI859_11225 [Pseudomonadota bacterium]